MKPIRKNEEYSKRMLGEGSEIPSDEDSNFTMKLPEWADERKIKMGQNFFLLNIASMSRSLFMGLVAVGSIPSILKVLTFTKQSSTPALAFRRFKMNALHAELWYKHPIKEGSPAWKSLETVRKVHVVVGKRTQKAGIGIISQKDMALTQFLFMGFQLLHSQEFGVIGTREQFEAFSHLWRVIGYMLGIEDRFNCCGETLEETRSRLKAMTQDMMLPELKIPCPEFEQFAKMTSEALWHSNPLIHYESVMFFTKRYVGVPGYHLFESEAKGVQRKVFNELSLYTQFRILVDVIVYEYLSNFFIFHWLLNIAMIFIAVLDKNAILARMRYGRKYADVEIMKSNK